MRFAKLRNENGMRVAHPEQIECSSVTLQHDTGEAVAWDKDGNKALAELQCARVDWMEPGGVRISGVERIPNTTTFRAQEWQVQTETKTC